MNWEDPSLRRMYRAQMHHAKRRGIRWRFTFQDWIAWWETNLGPDWLKKRGRKAGQFVMARNGDMGPYSKANCQCITCGENAQEAHSNKALSKEHRERISKSSKGNVVGERHGRHKLTDKEVIAIFHDKRTRLEIANAYDMEYSSIVKIKLRYTWTHITKEL